MWCHSQCLDSLSGLCFIILCIFVILLLCTSFPCVYALSSVCLWRIKMFILTCLLQVLYYSEFLVTVGRRSVFSKITMCWGCRSPYYNEESECCTIHKMSDTRRSYCYAHCGLLQYWISPAKHVDIRPAVLLAFLSGWKLASHFVSIMNQFIGVPSFLV